MAASASLRPAIFADAEAMAALHAAVWRETYRHLAPATAIAALTEARRLRQWQDVLGRSDSGSLTLLAEIDGRIVGFVHAAAPQEPLFDARREVKYLYVGRALARRGIGRLLLKRIAFMLHAQGHQAMALGVVAGNEPAIQFYEALGGKLIGRYTDPGPLWRSENLLYGWDDLAAFMERYSGG